jgi:hypothetical protein
VYGYPSIARDAVSGNVYVSANGAAVGFGQFNMLAFATSTNGGSTFSAAVNAANPALAASDYVDVSSIAVDNASGVGQGIVYFAYGRYGAAVDVQFSSYLHSAFSYTTAASPASGDQASTPWVTVAPNHYVYVVYYGSLSSMPFVGMVKSINQGGTFSAPAQIQALHMPFLVGTYNGDLGLEGQGTDGGATPVGLYASPQIVANPMTGALYVSYVDATMGADKSNIYFTHSEDGGTTWSMPVQVNDDTTTHDQFLPAIAVTPDGKRLAIDFYDRRNDPNNLISDRYGATATISGAAITFDPNVRITKSSFPTLAFAGSTTGSFAIHSAMSADATYFYDAFTDSANGNLNVELARYGVLY